MAASMSVRARGIGGPASADVSRCWLGLENEGETGWLDETKEVEEEDSHLDLQEIRNRVERMRREVRNRRKILIKSLPLDITNQEVHNLLAEYELKYCFVDKYKGTAYVTLLNGEQAEDAIHRFHQTRLRDRELSVQLQPTDALLCIANLPHSYTQQQFEDLVRPFGNLERCFLVYNEVTGNPKGYGFVEYMKKDSASRAKSDLFGRQLGTRTLYVHWSDVSQLSYELLHSHCLCVEQLVECETGVLKEAFSKVCQPSFCQLAYGQDGQFKGFAVVEYDSKEVTEIVQQKMNGSIVAGSRVRVSFCAPGPRGRSMLAALIAAQATALNRGKGLLPEPNILQILSSLGSSATLQLLLNPLLHGTSGNKQGILGAAPNVPLLANPALSAALLQLVLQNQTAQKPGILGDSPLAALYGALGLSPQITPPPGKQLLPDLGIGGSLAPVGLPSDLAAATAQLFSGPLGSEWDSPPQTPILGSILSGLQKPSEQGVSLLGEPPRDGNSGHFMSYHAKIPSTGSLGSSNKQVPYKPKPLGNRNHPLSMQDSMLTPSDSYQFEYPQELPPQRYSQNRDHTVPTMGTYESRPKLSPSSRFHERSSNIPAPLPPFSSGSPTSYFTSGLQAGFQQTNLKAVGMPPSSPGGVMLGYEDRSPNAENAYKTPIGAQKRGFSHLIPSPEPSPEGGYVGQHSQGLGGHYADSYLKRKRIF